VLSYILHINPSSWSSSSDHRPVVRRLILLHDWHSQHHQGNGCCCGSSCPVVACRPAWSAAAPPLPPSLPPHAAADRLWRVVGIINPPRRRAPSPALPFPASTVARPKPPMTDCHRRCRHCHCRCRRKLRRAPQPSCCVRGYIDKYLLFSKMWLYGQLGPWCHLAAALWREFNAKSFFLKILNSWAAFNFLFIPRQHFLILYSLGSI